jgi:MoaE-MoaD fusion protein
MTSIPSESRQQVRVVLLLFAAYREIAGASRLELAVPEGSSPLDVFATLETRHPRLAAMRGSTTFAVNREIVTPTTPLREGDEVAFLQPMSGGSHD